MRLFVFLFFPQAGTGIIELSHMSKNNGNPDLVCEKLHAIMPVVVTSSTFYLGYQQPHANRVPSLLLSVCIKLVYIQTVLTVYGPSTSHTISGDEVGMY